MNRSHKIAGVLPILHTPLDERDNIDTESLKRQIDWAFETGADGVCTGMVSEILRLSPDERNALHDQMVQCAGGRGVTVASVGAESVTQAIAFARHAQQLGCTALMAAPPVTVALPADSLLEYFRAIAHATSIPLIVQDASGYVGTPIPLEVCVQLLDEFGPDRILFKPEAEPVGPNLSRLREATGGQARIFEGSGGIHLIDSYRRGIAGTMPGMDLLDGIVTLWRALQEGDEETAYRIYFPICALVALELQAGLDGFLAIEKYLLRKRGIFTSERRREPIAWKLDEETRAEVDRLYERLQDVLQAR